MPSALAHQAVFLDKDGTLVEDVPYNVDPEQVRLMSGAVEGLRLLHAAGYRFVVVSNQPGVARGCFEENALQQVWRRLRELLPDIPLLGFYYCPHDPWGNVPRYALACECRKPAPGLILQAARHWALDLARSWMIGDILDDVEAGHRAGCRSVLVNNGHETEWKTSLLRCPETTVADLTEAARWIIKEDGR